MCFDDYKTLNLLLMSYRSWSGLIYLYILKSAYQTVDRSTDNGRPLLTENLRISREQERWIASLSQVNRPEDWPNGRPPPLWTVNRSKLRKTSE